MFTDVILSVAKNLFPESDPSSAAQDDTGVLPQFANYSDPERMG